MEKKNIFKNFSYSVLANGSNMLISVILVLVVPKILGVREYSYWQLYAFYASYLGFFHFGWADGIYLRFGGKKYEDLDKQYFNTQFWLLVLLEVIISVIIIITSLLHADDADKKVVFIMLGICCLLWLPRTLLQYLLQTTNRISDYAKNFMMEKVVYAVLVLGMLCFGIKDYKVLLSADLVAKGWTLILLVKECRDIVLRPVENIVQGVWEAWINISVGIKLLFANIASLLITGVVRFAIENYWDVETFGKVSLTMTVSNMLMIFINAVGVVMYPLLKNTPEERMPQIYNTLRSTLMLPVLGLLASYYPAKVILSAWLPKYAESLKYMALLFPMCIFESKMSMLINTYLKAMRKERVIMCVNCVTVILAVSSTGLLVYFMRNLTLAIASLAFLSGFRCIIAELALAKYLNVNVLKDIVWEVTLSLIFIVSGWKVESWMCFVIYLLAYMLYLYFHRSGLYEIINRVKETIIRR